MVHLRNSSYGTQVDCDLKEPDYEGLKTFLVDTHQFNAERAPASG